MKSYYQDNKLPEPTVPAVQVLTLLEGQTAIVTGGNSGIGKAIAISLGKAGANVVVNYVVKPEEAEAVAAEIRKSGQRAMITQADVSDEAQVQAMFAAAVQAGYEQLIQVSRSNWRKETTRKGLTVLAQTR